MLRHRPKKLSSLDERGPIMSNNRFAIVFKKLSEAQDEEVVLGRESIEVKSLEDELNEIDELRRIVLEITDPEPQSYTTT